MGTIISRTRKDGSTAYLAQILIKQKGKIVFRQSETFDRRQAAKAWLSRRETELRKPGALDQREDPTLSAVIDRYIEESRQIGKTKAQVLDSIKNNYDISATRCSEIDSAALVAFRQGNTGFTPDATELLESPRRGFCGRPTGVALPSRSAGA